jgi:hypothetical protein
MQHGSAREVLAGQFTLTYRAGSMPREVENGDGSRGHGRCGFGNGTPLSLLLPCSSSGAYGGALRCWADMKLGCGMVYEVGLDCGWIGCGRVLRGDNYGDGYIFEGRRWDLR